MKLQTPFSGSCRGTAAHRGFTLAEVLIASTVFSLLVGGIVFAHLFGLRMFQITETKLNATDSVRKMIGRMVDEIRTCKISWVGNVKNVVDTNGVQRLVFEARLDGEIQQATGLLIQPTTNAANFIIYYVNPADQTFRRTTSTPGTPTTTVLAESVTNSVVFQAQNYLGTVLTNNQNNRVIHLNLEFYQPKRYMQPADYYKLETSVTRRALE